MASSQMPMSCSRSDSAADRLGQAIQLYRGNEKSLGRPAASGLGAWCGVVSPLALSLTTDIRAIHGRWANAELAFSSERKWRIRSRSKLAGKLHPNWGVVACVLKRSNAPIHGGLCKLFCDRWADQEVV